MRIGENLRRLREENDMTQQELAKIIGKSRAAIGKYETGARLPDNNTLHAICDHFNVTTDYMMGRSEFKRNAPIELENCLSEESVITLKGKLLSKSEKSALLSMINAAHNMFHAEEENK